MLGANQIPETKSGNCYYSLICSLAILFFLLVFSIDAVYAQQAELDKKVTLKYSSEDLHYVLQDITSKTKTRFSYNPNSLPLDTLITYSCSDKELRVALKEICQQANLKFEFVEGHVVLKHTINEIEVEVVEEEVLKYFSVSGYITDAKNQEALIGASVYDETTGIGTTTNNYGYFSITLPEGNYKLNTSYLGYTMASQTVQLSKSYKWNISLEPSVSMVDEIVVSSKDRELYMFNAMAAQTDLKPFEVKKQTAALGETDMLKSFDNLPGISFQSDGSSYFYVRGGNRDQNLILLDEAPIYNPSHMLGLFTPIIPDAVKTATLYKADFPIQYGGRLSSLIDIRTRDGNMERFAGSASVGTVATRFSFEGPLKKQSSSYFVSYRRSHLGALIKSVQPNIQELFFTDFTAKLNFRLGKKDRLFLTVYNGKDKFIAEESSSLANGLEWGNTSFTARWNHLFGNRLFVNTTFYTSKYNYYLHTDYTNNLYWNSHISSAHLKSEFTWFVNPKHQINYGVKLGTYFFNPGNYNGPEITYNNTVSTVNSNEFLIYAGDEFKISEKFHMNYGLRFTQWTNSGEAFVVNYENYEPISSSTYKQGEKYYSNNSIEPRISLSYLITDFSSLKVSYNRTLQHINLINNSISPFNSLEVWLPSGPNIKPQQAAIYNLGYAHVWPSFGVEFTSDIYYKSLFNQVGYDYHANTLLNPLLEGELRQGDGKAYGFELLLKKTQGKFTGQLGYGFTRSLLTIPGLNGGREYKSHQDKPIDLSLGLGYNIKPRWLATLNILYGSGMKITTPTSFYYYRGTQVPVYSVQNNDRLPAYRRVDLASDFKLNKQDRNFEHHLIVSIYNVLGFKNPAFLYFTKTVDDEGNLLIPTDKSNVQMQIPTQRYIYYIIPSITYTLKF